MAVNQENHMIEACVLSDLGAQDCQGFGELMDACDGPLGTVIGDGAYDRFSCYEAMQKKGGRGIFPPQQNAVTSQERPQNKKKASPEAVAKRDETIKNIRSLGRAEWKKQTGYQRRSLAETAMSRIKRMLGKELIPPSFRKPGTGGQDLVSHP